ncbi:MAG: HEPN domain-containing protein [Deltaproteobacteria bacterium]|nr:HEPN domain-containing protein [Deltaproteobacteria bacterium]
MADRSQDWFRQAEDDLGHAQDARERGRHNWACFAAHQAAEMAIKALHLRLGQDAWGHVVHKLLAALPPGCAVPGSLPDKARVLDAYYVPTRYANGHPEGAPFEHYGEIQSSGAIEYAREILEFVRHAGVLGAMSIWLSSSPRPTSRSANGCWT